MQNSRSLKEAFDLSIYSLYSVSIYIHVTIIYADVMHVIDTFENDARFDRHGHCLYTGK